MKIFESVADLQAAKLRDNQLVQCKRYYVGGDLVEGLQYYVKTAAQAVIDGDVVDGYANHALINGNIAVLQHNGLLNVKQLGAVGDGATDDTLALQAAHNATNKSSGGTSYSQTIKLQYDARGVYIITRPLEIHGDGLMIDGQFATIRKTTNDIPLETISNISSDVPGGAVSPNQNAIFISRNRIRFSKIENFNLEGVSGSSAPSGMWLVGNENVISNIFIRFCNHGLHVPSMWSSKVAHVVVRNAAGNSFFWDRDRISGVGQSGTSIHFDNCFSFASAGEGFSLNDLDYPTLSACGADFSLGRAYFFRACSGIKAGIAFESRAEGATNESIRFSSGASGSVTIDTFDETTGVLTAIKATDSKITLTGRLRVDCDTFFDASLNSCIDASNLDISPISGDSADPSKYTIADNSVVLYTKILEPLNQNVKYTFKASGVAIEAIGENFLTTNTSGGRDIFFGKGALRVVYDVVDFDTTWGNEIKIPLSDIFSAIPSADGSSWGNRPLNVSIFERENVGIGYYIIIRSGVLSDWGQSTGYTVSGSAPKVLISAVAIVSDELVITLDGTGGTRQRVACEISK